MAQEKTDFSQFCSSLLAGKQCQSALARMAVSHSLNANILLFIVWSAQHNSGRFKHRQLQLMAAAVEPWHERVVNALEQFQKSVSAFPAQKVSTLKIKLQGDIDYANEVEQKLITQACKLPALRRRNEQQQLTDACYNILKYYLFSHSRLDHNDIFDIEFILKKAFQTQDEKTISSVFEMACSRLELRDMPAEQLSLCY